MTAEGDVLPLQEEGVDHLGLKQQALPLAKLGPTRAIRTKKLVGPAHSLPNS